MINYTPLSEAKDVNGQTVKVGNICIFIGEDDHIGGRRGKKVIIRAISAPRTDKFNTFASGPRKGQPKPGFPKTTIELRVDDDIDHPDDHDGFGWSAWVQESDLVFS